MTTRLFDDFISLFYPEICCGCLTPLVNNEELICLECSFGLPKTDFHCLPENPILRIFLGKVSICQASSYLYFVKGGIVQSLLHHLKYKNRPEIGVMLGEKAGEDLKQSFLSTIDQIIPIPLHPKKLKKRGYNQSEEIAIGIAKSTGISVNKICLQRVTHNETQTRKARFERWLNTASVFSVHEEHLLRDSHVLLVDDVITTGSTMEAALSVINEVKGIKISVFTLAFA